VSSWIDGFPSRIQEIDAKHLRFLAGLAGQLPKLNDRNGCIAVIRRRWSKDSKGSLAAVDRCLCALKIERLRQLSGERPCPGSTKRKRATYLAAPLSGTQFPQNSTCLSGVRGLAARELPTVESGGSHREACHVCFRPADMGWAAAH
jgi:hypothetical protein